MQAPKAPNHGPVTSASCIPHVLPLPAPWQCLCVHTLLPDRNDGMQKGRTPRDLAVLEHHKAMVELLTAKAEVGAALCVMEAMDGCYCPWPSKYPVLGICCLHECLLPDDAASCHDGIHAAFGNMACGLEENTQDLLL